MLGLLWSCSVYVVEQILGDLMDNDDSRYKFEKFSWSLLVLICF